MTDAHIEAQKQLCTKYGVTFSACASEDRVGVAVATLARSPIYGVRKKNADGSASWYVWAGEYSTVPDFYQPLCASHLIDLLPISLPYLGLPSGYKFIIDRSGYEDVWQEEEANQSLQPTPVNRRG